MARVIHELSILVDRFGLDAVKRGCALLLSPDYDSRQPLHVVALYTQVPPGDLLAAVVLEPMPEPWGDIRLTTPEPFSHVELPHSPLKAPTKPSPDEQDCDL